MTAITCPHCQQTIDVDEALTHQMEAKYREEKEQALQKQKQELWQKAQLEAQKKEAGRLKDMGEQLRQQETRAQVAEAKELELLKKKRELEDEKKQLDLKLERELATRLETAIEQANKIEAERFSLKEREYQKQIQDFKKIAEEAQRKASATSQQLQGEALELELEKLFRATFPDDMIAEVKKGHLGADIVHTVKTHGGKTVGIIVWELKQTKDFKKEWLAKLREDCRECHGSLAVLVTKTLPPELKTAGEIERVWVTAIEFVIPLAHLLRQTLLKVDQEKTAQSGKDVKTAMLYQYINSQEFRGRIEGIVESFREMKDDLEREQTAMQKIWSKRDKQILRLATNTAYMYGEMQGVVGASLPNIQGLELESGVQPIELMSGQEELGFEAPL